jgi:hypothetical protein
MTLFKLHAILACQDDSLSSRSPPIQLPSSSAIAPGYGKKAPRCDKNATTAYHPGRPMTTI